ncbi:MAG TPA: isocitrate/isopropylmalate dehydrogenase family protein [Candidatus Altiarchaeales archaeon]|nr:isocitrate/isopropylmalate dehydrogenase family protein [Candidatus Altiarchaeales archaeon]HEX55110.1 isocitrate/isopropylmalate dehydrogenase family protein [Candidatus Altiarchaeales archaeon]
MSKYKIALIPGDGIGPEIIREGKRVLDRVSEIENFEIEWHKYNFGADNYLETGELINEEDLNEIEGMDAIYLGALGDPRVEPGVLEKGILLYLRFYFDQFVNLRPVKLLEGVECPLKNKSPDDIDFVVVRENTEDFYVGIGGNAMEGKSRNILEIERSLYSVKFDLDIESDGDEIAYQIGVLSRKGCERVIRYAFELAKREGRKRVTSVDKANVLTYAYGFWREIFTEISREYEGIETEFNFVDAITMWFIKNPEWYDVIVTPNMFGDIITDLGAMIQGGLGLAPGGNINPEGISMFEPIHGSAPKYAGKNVANPIATIWAGALMLNELNEVDASKLVLRAIEEVLKEGKVRTKDLGGNSKTSEVGDAIVEKLSTLV